ncbi:RICIN domain-containing protein [Kitasatospora viridis]|uniref:Uncharacterized protein n=1 Tax=Kitasatospora viridis TaxID=281105 RepID=A0A561TV76_9ACTN|nr:RICIN domain-containing protein [Kitasatospora viridis]TWF91014.1 hypothetical protein FHX73_12126 [Kitasatospora viridis]
MRTSSRGTARFVKASLLGLVTTSLLAVGAAAPASAASGITWQNGLYGHSYYLASNGYQAQPFMAYGSNPPASNWTDIENSDGTWDEVDFAGFCLTGYGSTVETMPCNDAKDATDGHMRWREINTGDGWKLQNVLSGYFLDWTGSSPNTGTVYLHNGDAGNPNERWY